MVSSIIQGIFNKIQPNMSEQEKKRQRIYDLRDAETKPKISLRNNWNFFITSIKPKP